MSEAQRPTGPEIRAGIAGAGLMGRWHAHALTRAGGRLLVVADKDLDAARRLAQRYGARAAATVEESSEKATIDAWHICTPPATHMELALRALDAGAHVLVEKPITPDSAAAGRLIAEAQTRNRILLPVHQFLFQSGVQDALRRRTRIEPLLHLEMVAATGGAEGRGPAAQDRLVADILPHALSLFQRFLLSGVDKVEWSCRRPTPGELRALGQSGEVTLGIQISAGARPTRNLFNILGGRGSVQADLFHGFAVFESGRVARAQKIWRPFGLSLRTLAAGALNLAGRAARNQPAYPGLRELIRAFYQAIRHETPPPMTVQEILAIARARDRLIDEANLQSEL